MSQKKSIDNVIHRTFTAGQAARVAGLPYHDVNYWAKTNFLVPSVRAASGSSSCRAYSFSDLVALCVARKLRKAGIGLQGLRKVVEHLRKRGYEQPLADAFLIVAPDKDVIEVAGDKLISALKRQGQTCFAFALGETVNEVMESAGILKTPTRGKASKVA